MKTVLENGGRVVSRAVFAENCGCTEQTLRRWIADGMPALNGGRIRVREAHRWVVERQAERIAALAAGQGGRAKVLLAKKSRRAELVEIIDHTIGGLRRINNAGPPWDPETAQALLRASLDDLVDEMLMRIDDEQAFVGVLQGAADIAVREARRLYLAGVEWRDGAAGPRL
jgi:hypothetical protein